jgi:phosphatidylglycerophosphate synthase
MNDEQPDLERRPLATRKLPIAKALAKALAATGITPNAISGWGMVAGVLAGGSLALTAHVQVQIWWWLAGAALIQLRLLANMLDGMVALETGKDSPIGELYNEIPDRVSDAATLIGLGYAAGSSATAGYIAACVALFVAYVRAMGKAAGAPQDFCGPMSKPRRMFFATVVALWCGLTPAAWQDWGGTGAPVWVLGLIIIGGAFTAVRRLIRIARVLRGGESTDR